MDSSFYRDLTVTLAGSEVGAELAATVVSNPACGGPWHPELQHGGPPNALLVHLAELLAAAAAGRTDLVAVRLAAEFVGPVPVQPLTAAARVDRLSRTAVLVTASLSTATEPVRICLQSRIWLLAPGELPSGRAMPNGRGPAPAPEALPALGFDNFPYARHLDWRLASGTGRAPGPAAAWISARVPLLPERQYSPLQRTALFADSASGISAELDWQDWSFANVDLDLHLFAPPAGEWLLVDAVTELGAGVAMTRCRLSDRDGPVGAGLQTLLVRRAASR
ncbi:MAG TPA: acyl-CoA thioesterase domain-containing protein [Jatrophihabitans sp.]|nr:acyl-CoA thioesterase domain-containing protein [Jatrophihabitans sp.]